MADNTGYEQWSHEQLITKIKELEGKLASSSSSSPPPRTGGTNNPAESNTDTSTSFSIPALGAEAHTTTAQTPYRKPPKQPPKAFDASKYNTRFIALKFAYLGQNYQGFEHHTNNKTPLPTIEEELWKALMKTRLINPTKREGNENQHDRIDQRTYASWDRDGADVNWEGCEYSKCGRTDRGVSAFGQVIGIRVRSSRPLPKSKLVPSRPEYESVDQQEGVESEIPENYAPLPSDSETEEPLRKPFDDFTDELPYIELINRVLPPDIRVYAWCPNPPPDFSARFSCKERRYKYFFTNPCFAPPPGSSSLYPTSASGDEQTKALMREGWLDIAKMQEACNHLIGLHDVRNFCKIDASKQLTNFQRRIFHAVIEEISPLSLPPFLSHPNIAPSPPSTTNTTTSSSTVTQQQQQPKMYAFVVHGSAFLWHQVRSLAAILFLVGQGLEPPSIVPSLLDIAANPTRPKYEMASDAPLVLWDCIFPHPEEVQSSEERERGYEDRLDWIYVGDNAARDVTGKGKWGRGGVVDDVWEVWRRNKIDETLSGLLLDRIAGLGKSSLDAEAFVLDSSSTDGSKMSGGGGGNARGCRVFDGGNVGRAKGVYTPVLKRERQEPVEVVNAKYAKRKGLDVMKMLPRDDEADE